MKFPYHYLDRAQPMRGTGCVVAFDLYAQETMFMSQYDEHPSLHAGWDERTVSPQALDHSEI